MITDSVCIAYSLSNNIYQCIFSSSDPDLTSYIIATNCEILEECNTKIQRVDLEEIPVTGFQKSTLIDMFSQMDRTFAVILNYPPTIISRLSSIDIDTLKRCKMICLRNQQTMKQWKTTDFE